MKKIFLIGCFILAVVSAFGLYFIIISTLVNNYLNEYSDIGRSEAILKFYENQRGGVFYLGSSSIKEDLDMDIIDSVNCLDNFNLGNPASTPIRILVEVDNIIKASPENVVFGVGSMSFSEKWLFPYDQYAIISQYVEDDVNFYNESYPLELNRFQLLLYKRKFVPSALYNRFDLFLYKDKPISYKRYNLDFKSVNLLSQSYSKSDPRFIERINTNESFSEYQVNNEINKEKIAFEEIIKKLKKENIKVVILKIPLNPLLKDKINFDGYNKFIEDISEKYNLVVLDYTFVYDKELFYDAHHLNEGGRIKFSRDIGGESAIQ